MKKKVITLVLSALMMTGLVGCGNDNSSNSGEATLKVGMVTTQEQLMISHLIKVLGKEL